MDCYKLYENEPARSFEDAHLLGNGSLGASVYGGVPYETILLNHDTLWSGQERDKIGKGTKANLAKARELILSGRLREANDLINDEMLGYWSEAYLPLGNLHLTVGHTGDRRSMKQKRILQNDDPVLDYRRELLLDSALERVEYIQRGIRFTREMFVSHADGVLAVRLTAEGGPLDFSMSVDSPLRHEQRVENGAVLLTGRAPDRVEPYAPAFEPRIVYREDERTDALRFAAYARVAATDGAVACDEFRLYVRGATYAELCVSADTSYAGFRVRRSRDARAVLERCRDRVRCASRKPYAALRRDHIADYRALYGRFSIRLGEALTEEMPTSERLRLCRKIDDPSLSALAAQVSRYLLIASSRPGSQPANLQGIWNPSVCSAWACNYTTNINVEMNYWGAEPTGLPECHEPLLDFVKDLAVSGERTAEELYGARGWVAHHNSDLWRMTELAGEDASWAWWPFGGVWLCRHLWQHYAYTGDAGFLAGIYPVLQGAVEFILGYVTPDGDGFYVTAPSTSPENKFVVSGRLGGERLRETDPENRFSADLENVSAVCKASSMDLEMIRELFGHYMEAARLLGCRPEHTEDVARVSARLYPLRIGKYGQLQEWDRDYEECTPGMAHVSHLYGVYPARVISRDGTPELFEAARTSMRRRLRHGGMHRNWPGAWGLCLAARFGDGALCGEIGAGLGEGLSASLLVKDVFQMDCVMGWGAGIAEMLLQSGDGCLRLLPAPAPSWRQGEVRGLRAPGGFTVDLEWSGGALQKAVISSEPGGHRTVRYAGARAEIDLPAGGRAELNGRLEPLRG